MAAACSISGEPKYLNSPETPLFQKGYELYGLFEARQAIRDAGYVLVTEGYMDVVALAQLGFPQAVATLGTACTSTHVQKLLRQTDTVIFSFDGDRAGRKAARRALEACLPQVTDNKTIKFLFLPQEHDPDSFVREFGAEAFEQEIHEAMPLSQFLLREVSGEHDLSTPEGRARAQFDAKPLLQSMTPTVAAPADRARPGQHDRVDAGRDRSACSNWPSRWRWRARRRRARAGRSRWGWNCRSCASWWRIRRCAWSWTRRRWRPSTFSAQEAAERLLQLVAAGAGTGTERQLRGVVPAFEGRQAPNTTTSLPRSPRSPNRTSTAIKLWLVGAVRQIKRDALKTGVEPVVFFRADLRSDVSARYREITAEQDQLLREEQAEKAAAEAKRHFAEASVTGKLDACYNKTLSVVSLASFSFGMCFFQ